MVFRVQKTRDYTIMSNAHLKDKGLSLKAKGLLSVMLSLPDEWDYSIDGLVTISKENETAIKSTLKELRDCGYLEVIKLMPNQTESGRIEYVYNVYENPKQEGKKQGVENLGVEIQAVENQPQLITKESNTKDKDIYCSIPYEEIVDYLNKVCGTAYRASSKKTRDVIKARFNEGFCLDDFKKVIDNKAAEWLNNGDMCKYLRPETLFGNKFEGYLNQKNAIAKNGIEIDSKFRNFLAQNEVVDFGI